MQEAEALIGEALIGEALKAIADGGGWHVAPGGEIRDGQGRCPLSAAFGWPTALVMSHGDREGYPAGAIAHVMSAADDIHCGDGYPGVSAGATAERRRLRRQMLEMICAYESPGECSAARERSVAGVSNVIPDCPRHGAYIGEA